ncbi:hypothetical protein [Mycolicibacterium mengxianglii]|uniref:hypothetical protein n=1 Tax=Mycolicibacterium mengxianglii TaxID=2736649 RepID=UPI0018D1A778|nr:hypothetical protein [Mycolicibacterium mengxianglii]
MTPTTGARRLPEDRRRIRPTVHLGVRRKALREAHPGVRREAHREAHPGVRREAHLGVRLGVRREAHLGVRLGVHQEARLGVRPRPMVAAGAGSSATPGHRSHHLAFRISVIPAPETRKFSTQVAAGWRHRQAARWRPSPRR